MAWFLGKFRVRFSVYWSVSRLSMLAKEAYAWWEII